MQFLIFLELVEKFQIYNRISRSFMDIWMEIIPINFYFTFAIYTVVKTQQNMWNSLENS